MSSPPDSPDPHRRERDGAERDALWSQPWNAQPDCCCGLAALLAERGHADRYELLEELARGGMSTVYAVWDKRLRRRVALKRCELAVADLPDGCLHRSSDALVARFATEMQILSLLHHPNIVPLYDFGLDERGHLFFTMPLIGRGQLRDVIDDLHSGAGPDHVYRALAMMLRVGHALRYAHTKGVVHCDLKPRNIAVGPLEETYILDWGLARVVPRRFEAPAPGSNPSTFCLSFLERRTSLEPDSEDSQRVAGTPSYMPPEQARGIGGVSPRSDIYAYGAVLYHLLSGRPPYEDAAGADGNAGVLRAVLRGPPAPLADVAPDVPGELVAVCERCMARIPEDRYSDMASVGADLRGFVEGRLARRPASGVRILGGLARRLRRPRSPH